MTYQPPGPPPQQPPPSYQPPRQAPQQPQPGGPPGQPPLGWLALTLQGSMMTSSMIPPRVRLNGYPVSVSYGVNAIPVHPGRIHVDASCQWLREYGQASLDVDVVPGQTVPVFYATPYHQFTRGRMGHEKQQRPGLVAMLVIVALIVAVPLAGIVLMVVAG